MERIFRVIDMGTRVKELLKKGFHAVSMKQTSGRTSILFENINREQEFVDMSEKEVAETINEAFKEDKK